MDEHWEHAFLGDPDNATPHPPSWYFQNRCIISTEAGEAGLRALTDALGPDIAVLASDYPHPDVVGKFPDKTIGDLLDNPALTTDEKQRILWDNPARFFNLTNLQPTPTTTHGTGAARASASARGHHRALDAVGFPPRG